MLTDLTRSLPRRSPRKSSLRRPRSGTSCAGIPLARLMRYGITTMNGPDRSKAHKRIWGACSQRRPPYRPSTATSWSGRGSRGIYARKPHNGV